MDFIYKTTATYCERNRTESPLKPSSSEADNVEEVEKNVTMTRAKSETPGLSVRDMIQRYDRAMKKDTEVAKTPRSLGQTSAKAALYTGLASGQANKNGLRHSITGQPSVKQFVYKVNEFEKINQEQRRPPLQKIRPNTSRPSSSSELKASLTDVPTSGPSQRPVTKREFAKSLSNVYKLKVSQSSQEENEKEQSREDEEPTEQQDEAEEGFQEDHQQQQPQKPDWVPELKLEMDSQQEQKPESQRKSEKTTIDLVGKREDLLRRVNESRGMDELLPDHIQLDAGDCAIQTSYQSRTTISKSEGGVRITIDIFFDSDNMSSDRGSPDMSRIETSIPSSRILNELQERTIASSRRSEAF